MRSTFPLAGTITTCPFCTVTERTVFIKRSCLIPSRVSIISRGFRAGWAGEASVGVVEAFVDEFSVEGSLGCGCGAGAVVAAGLPLRRPPLGRLVRAVRTAGKADGAASAGRVVSPPGSVVEVTG